MNDVMIEARDLNKAYGPVHALRDVNFEIRKGEVLGFLGPNGAGKTTTMKILTCFIAPSGGTAKINGADIFEQPIEVRKSIGYLPESTPLYPEMLVLEYLEFIARMRGFRGDEVKKRIRTAVEQTSLGDVISKEIRALSKGYRQRVGLAQALIHEPSILILDEPMSGLDPNQASEIRNLIRSIGRERTVILSTHNLAEVQVTCGRVLIIANGRIVADDTPDDLRDRAGQASYIATVASPESGYRDAKFETQVSEALTQISRVKTVKKAEGDTSDELQFHVLPKDNHDVRADIFKAAVDGGFVLLGLEKTSEDLGAVFRGLTTGDVSESTAGSRKSKGDADAHAANEERASQADSDENTSEES